MPKVKKILLAMDFSEAADQLAEYAKLFAKNFDAALYVLYVSPTMNRYAKMYVTPHNIEELVGKILEGAKKAMDEYMVKYFQGIDATGSVEYGYAPVRILEVAEEIGADMILMGTHGRKGVDRILFGSVAEKVVKTAKIPVVTVRPH